MDQLQILRKMSGSKRLAQAFYLSDFILRLAILNIKDQLGMKASKKEIMKRLRERLRES